jgi:hypothetical protein
MNNPYSPPAAYGPPYTAPSAYDPRGPAAVSELAIELLRLTRPWVMLLSVLSFLGSAFMFVVGLAVVGIGLFSHTAKFEAALGLVYLPIAAVYVYPAIKLWTYASAISRLLVSRGTAELEAALAQQKSFWKFLGIAVIVMFAVYFAAIGVMAVVAIAKIH